MSKKRNKFQSRKTRRKYITPPIQDRGNLSEEISQKSCYKNEINTSSKISTVQALDMTGLILKDFRKSIIISILLFGLIVALYVFGSSF